MWAGGCPHLAVSVVERCRGKLCKLRYFLPVGCSIPPTHVLVVMAWPGDPPLLYVVFDQPVCSKDGCHLFYLSSQGIYSRLCHAVGLLTVRLLIWVSSSSTYQLPILSYCCIVAQIKTTGEISHNLCFGLCQIRSTTGFKSLIG